MSSAPARKPLRCRFVAGHDNTRSRSMECGNASDGTQIGIPAPRLRSVDCVSEVGADDSTGVLSSISIQ